MIDISNVFAICEEYKYDNNFTIYNWFADDSMYYARCDITKTGYVYINSNININNKYLYISVLKDHIKDFDIYIEYNKTVPLHISKNLYNTGENNLIKNKLLYNDISNIKNTGEYFGDSDNYIITDYIPIRTHNVVYDIALVYSQSTKIILDFPGIEIRFHIYDKDKNFLYAGTRTTSNKYYNYSTRAFTDYNGLHLSISAAYIRFSYYYNGSNSLIFGYKDDIDELVANKNTHIIAPYYDNSTDFKILSIENPFYTNQSRANNSINLYFHFDYFTYTNGLYTYRYTWEAWRDVAPSGRKPDTYGALYFPDSSWINEDEILVFDPTIGRMHIENNNYILNNFEMTFAKYDKTNKILSGLLNKYRLKNMVLVNRIEKGFLNNEALDLIKQKEYNIFSDIDTKNQFIFCYFTDAHSTGGDSYTWQRGYETIDAVNRSDKKFDYDMILNTGDILLNGGGINAVSRLQEVVARFDNKYKYFTVEGNHDRGTINPMISRKEYYNASLRHLRNINNVHLVDDRAYYYVDFPNNNIRLIVLSLYNYSSLLYVNDHRGYDKEQLLWLVNTALNMPSNYSIIIATHEAPLVDSDGWTQISEHKNRIILRNILESFKNGTSINIPTTDLDTEEEFSISTNFQSIGPRDIIGVFTGHGHTDYHLKFNDIMYIQAMCGYIDITKKSLYPSLAIPFTYYSISYNICIVDTVNKNVKMRRIGLAENSYEDYEYNY